MNFDFASNQLCVTSADGGLVARLPNYFEEDPGVWLVTWFDLTHERRYPVREVIVDSSDRFTFETDDGLRFTLRPMTMKRYRSDVLPGLTGGKPKISNQADLERHFLVDTIAV